MHKRSSIFDCQIIHFPKIHNREGNITSIQNNIEIPFNIQRVYYLYDIPGGESRGAHGHKTLRQVMIAVSGSFDVTIEDGKNKKTVNLNRPYIGLYILPGIWRDVYNFSSGAICLVLASNLYDEKDYLRDYESFVNNNND